MNTPSLNIRAVGADLDGTLLSASNTLSVFARRTIEALHRKLLFFPVTGKSLALTRRILSDLDYPMVCLDGALIVANGEEQWDAQSFIDGTTADRILKRSGQVPAFALNNDCVFVQGDIQEPQYRHWACTLSGQLHTCRFEKLTVLVFLSRHRKQLEELKAESEAIDCSLATRLNPAEHSGEYQLVIYTRERTKHQGAVRLLEEYGLCLQDMLFLGDWKNDIPLLKHAGFPVAMRNADPALGPHACAITLFPNHEEGAAQFLESFFDL